MSTIYKPGRQAKDYHRLSRRERAAVAEEVDRLFRERSSVKRRLNPTSRSDLELRRQWLRIRDEVMEGREQKIIEEDMEFRRELLMDDLPWMVIEEMRHHKWNDGAELLETWAERPRAIAPQYSAPLTNLIKMDWVLRFDRAKSVYDAMIKDRIWTNPKSQGRIAELIKKNPQRNITPVTVSRFDLSRPVTEVDQEWINARPVTSSMVADGLTAALGAFEFQLAVAGQLNIFGGGMFTLTVEEVGIYVKDSFDFNGSQFLGFWGHTDQPVYNEDFRKWRDKHSLGGDFRVFSDIKRTRLNPADVVRGRL